MIKSRSFPPVPNRLVAMHLVRLIYCSEPSEPLNLNIVRDILTVARSRNRKLDVTGLLCFNESYFLQALEGPASSVNAIYNSVGRDARHKNLCIISYGEVKMRVFPLWAMGDVDLSTLHADWLAETAPTAAFLPHTMTPETALRVLLICEEKRKQLGEHNAL
jgi:hypothetical protein